jgi:hypothetical protein
MASEGADVRPGDGLVDGVGEVRSSAGALFAALIDYASLFPPAQLPMPAAVHNYAHYQDIPFSWIVGRFIVPASRLEEFEREATSYLPLPGSSAVWRLSLLSADPARDVKQLDDFNRTHSGALFDSIEIKADSAAEIAAAGKAIPRSLRLYCEIPPIGETDPLIAAIGKAGARAKVRCGGVSADAFPSADRVAGFLCACHADGVGFKATAGLHHPLRGIYPFTFELDSQKGLMQGFLNVSLAAAWVRVGMSGGEVVELLEERSAAAFRFFDKSGYPGVAVRNWRLHRLLRFGGPRSKCREHVPPGQSAASQLQIPPDRIPRPFLQYRHQRYTRARARRPDR